MNDSVVIIDLRRLLRVSDRHIEVLLREHPDMSDRVLYDRRKHGAVREYIYNRFWNILNETTKYNYIELEEDMFISKLFEDWQPNCWYRDENKDLIITDTGSFQFLSGWVEELDNDIKVLIERERLRVNWKILTLDISVDTLSVEISGDWRAQKWCEENNVEYTF